MRIIAVDPGYGRAGIAILEKKKNIKEEYIDSFCIETSPKKPIEERLFEVGSQFENAIQTYNPEFLAMETLFFGKNKKTAIAVAEMRGVFLFIAKKYNVRVFEYNPMTVKTALSAQDKKQIEFMVERLLTLPQRKRLDDEYDAIAIGLAHIALFRN